MKHSKPRTPLSAASIKTYVMLAKQVVASAIDKDGNQLYPRKWNNKFIGLPQINKKAQNRPSIDAHIMAGLAKYKIPTIAVLFILLGATGARLGEMLGIEIEKHISADFRTIVFNQKIRNRRIERRLKTEASYREVDLHPVISALLEWFVGERKAGFLFAGADGKPLQASRLYVDHLHPALEALGYHNKHTGNHKAGFHIFRRFRNTFLRNFTPCPEGLRAFWIGHEGDDLESGENRQKMGAHYDTIAENRPFRLHMAELCGIGFELPSFVPNVPISERVISGSQATHNEEFDWCI